MDVTRHVPKDVLAMIAMELHMMCSPRCGVCNRPYVQAVRSEALRRFQLVCKKWKDSWKRFILVCARTHSSFCARPILCLQRYMCGSPGIPLIILPLSRSDEDDRMQRTPCTGQGLALVPEMRNERRP